jgi:hypothetical protein
MHYLFIKLFKYLKIKEFYDAWDDGFKAYIEGRWDYAQLIFE